MFRRAITVCALCILAGFETPAFADTDSTSPATAQEPFNVHNVKAIAPIFGQLVLTNLPHGFIKVFEQTKGQTYIREAVLPGETVDKWTQMLTTTGLQGLALNPNVTPHKYGEVKAGAFKKACPASFNALPLGEGNLNGYDTFAVVLSCGKSTASIGETSETALIIVTKGAEDYYTVQWAERGEVSETPIPIDQKKWNERMRRLMPIKLCPIVKGEQAPYPSCVDQH